LLRAEPMVFGRVASDPTVSRTIDALAADAPRALKAIDTARAVARARVWSLAGEHAPDHRIDADRPLIIDTDATVITAHSDKEQAAPTFKRGFGLLTELRGLFSHVSGQFLSCPVTFPDHGRTG
jgi:Transposase DDE domain group 1